MTAKQVVAEVRKLMARCTDPEDVLLEFLLAEAEGWEARAEELQDEEDE